MLASLLFGAVQVSAEPLFNSRWLHYKPGNPMPSIGVNIRPKPYSAPHLGERCYGHYIPTTNHDNWFSDPIYAKVTNADGKILALFDRSGRIVLVIDNKGKIGSVEQSLNRTPMHFNPDCDYRLANSER